MNRVTVFGAGRSGVAAANFLRDRGVEVMITDAAREEELPLARDLRDGIRRFFGGHPPEVIETIDAIVVSPGIPGSIPPLAEAVSRGIPVISEIELAFRHLRGRVAAITGSNGKSTTTALLGEILDAAGFRPIVAGNIGQPLISSIDPDEARYYVIELSSFQLETVESFRADVAVLLNITPDHMDRYATIEEYAAAKYSIFRNQDKAAVAVVNADDPRTSEPATAARVWKFSSSRPSVPGAFLDAGELVLSLGEDESRIARTSLSIPGNANVENALAAWLAARALGASDGAVEKAFRRFRGLPHRMVVVREDDGVRWINDSKGTNVDATLKSLEGFDDGSVLLILGGKDKKGEFQRLVPVVKAKVRAVLTIGSAAGRIESALAGAAGIVPCGDMQGAVDYAREHARPGETVLLSPACASFDQYGNFEERGRHFEELVRGVEAGVREPGTS
jgi:UDP-N-acetylmuramoylalanine--D-glutamate ligase